jgi:CheY-like chemotaxis protein
MKIINDVLDLSKLENGKAELRENGVCLPELIEKLSHMLEYSMEQKKIAFQVVCEITNPYVVCDETKLQQILVNVISMEIDWGENGARCVEKLLDEKSPAYDFILMDIQMPVMDGLEVTRQIRACADRKKAQIPIIAMTANAFDEDVKRCLEAGMDAHLSKPLQMNQIMETLAKYCGKQ